MNTDKNDKKLDELMCRAVAGNKPHLDFDKWKKEHKEQVEIFQSQKDSAPALSEPGTRKITLWRKVSYLAAALLLAASWVACFVLSGRVTDLQEELAQAQAQQNITSTPVDDSATINFYLEEHRDLAARHAAVSSTAPQPARVQVNRKDILYYESFDDEPDYMNPGIVVRGPSTQLQTDPSEAPVISNGHTLTLQKPNKPPILI